MPKPFQHNYRMVMVIVCVSFLLFGVAFFLLTNAFLQTLNTPIQTNSDLSPMKEDLLVLGISMIAGLPAVGIGAYVAFQGSQLRGRALKQPLSRGENLDPKPTGVTSNKIRGILLMVLGGLITFSGFILPLVVWWAR